MGNCKCFEGNNEMKMNEYSIQEISNTIMTINQSLLISFNINSQETKEESLESPDISPGCRIIQFALNNLVISGGVNNESLFAILQNQTWQIKKMSNKRSYHGVCYDNMNKIYLISGFSNKQCIKECEYYDLVKHKFKRILDIPSPIKRFGCAMLDNCIYCFGGLKNEQLSSATNTILQYITDCDQ